ncbi:MAG: hypothetical protein ACRDST_20875, partial [Pseudonocardiaceae bacterium]
MNDRPSDAAAYEQTRTVHSPATLGGETSRRVDPGSPTLVGGLLDRAARAFPAASEENRHGWWMRHTDSSMWWSGAVLAH